MTLPLWFVRWVLRHRPRIESQADLERWWEDAGPILVKGMVAGLEKGNWRIVRFDSNTGPGERPIVTAELTSADFDWVH